MCSYGRYRPQGARTNGKSGIALHVKYRESIFQKWNIVLCTENLFFTPEIMIIAEG